jgi:hypothetical protein
LKPEKQKESHVKVHKYIKNAIELSSKNLALAKIFGLKEEVHKSKELKY